MTKVTKLEEMEKEKQIEQWIELHSSELLNRAVYLISDKELTAKVFFVSLQA